MAALQDKKTIMANPEIRSDEQYLTAAARVLGHVKTRTYELMQLQSGQHVLDLGCGPGIDTVALSEVVGPEGKVVGVDHDSAMIAAADQRAAQAGVRERVRHYLCDAAKLPFDDASFAASRSERVFQHLDDPRAALREMSRATRQNGRVVVVDADWGTMSLDANEIDVERRLVQFAAQHRHRSGYAGRQLYRIFKEHGLGEIDIETFVVHGTKLRFLQAAVNMRGIGNAALAAGVVTDAELAQMYADVELRDRSGSFFWSINLVLVGGSVP